MFCDWVNISVPEDSSHEVEQELRLILGMLGAVAGIRVGTSIVHRLDSGGTLKHTEKKGFSVFGASGGFISRLRIEGYFDNYLSIFASVPHRVTKMDIAHDVNSDAPPILKSLYRRAKKGDIKLTKKNLNPTQVKFLQKPRYDGEDSETVYLGNRTSEVHAKVYDKMAELQDKSFNIHKPLTHYKLNITSKVGISLKDVHSPEPLFWRFMGNVLPKPKNVPEWLPLGDNGFSIQPSAELLPAEVMRRKVDVSEEVASLLALADQCGENGFDYLLSLFKQKANRSHLSIVT